MSTFLLHIQVVYCNFFFHIKEPAARTSSYWRWHPSEGN